MSLCSTYCPPQFVDLLWSGRKVGENRCRIWASRVTLHMLTVCVCTNKKKNIYKMSFIRNAKLHATHNIFLFYTHTHHIYIYIYNYDVKGCYDSLNYEINFTLACAHVAYTSLYMHIYIRIWRNNYRVYSCNYQSSMLGMIIHPKAVGFTNKTRSRP